MGIGDFVGSMGFPTDWSSMGTSLFNPAGATMTDPLSGVTTKLGYINPNSTPEGAQLRSQIGTWGDTANLAGQQFASPYVAPQMQQPIMRQAPVTDMRAAQGQAMSGRASTALGSQLNLGQSDQTRQGQQSLISSLQGTAAGVGPSVAQEQLRQSTAANIANQASAAQSAHGAARLAALRNSAANQAQIQQQANSQAAGLRAQEIQGAQANLGQALGLTRSQDINAAGTNAQLAQQMAQFNAGNQQQMGLANLSAGNQMALANLQAQQQANQFNAGASNTSSLNFAQQQNQGNLAMGQQNLLAQLQTQGLNERQASDYLAAVQRAAQGQTDIASKAYQGTADYNKAKQDAMMKGTEQVGGILNNMGGATSILGML